MKQDFLTEFIAKAKEDQEKILALEKRKKHFQNIGRKGGLVKKKAAPFSKIISTKVTEKEYQKIQEKAEELHLKLSKYARLVLTEQELKINEFKTDEILLQFGNNFKKITNLLRNREWTVFENKKEILAKIETTVDMIHHYLYSKIQKNE